MSSFPRSFPTTAQLLDHAARHCIELIRQADATRPFLLALSGGRTAQPLFESFARQAPSINHVHFFWADERCVPPDHPDSNFALANQFLFQPLKIPSHHIHRIPGELDPAAAARHAQSELQTVSESDLPCLDLVLLGMGEDGHIASLFPEQPSPEQCLFHDVIAPKPPPHRVTMSYALLQDAAHILTLVSGHAKAGSLRRSLNPGDTPLGKLIRLREETDIWCDFSQG